MTEFVIHGKIVTLNQYINAERSNKFQAAAIKRDEMDRIMWKLPAVTLEGKHDFAFVYYDDNRRTDPDNYQIFSKFFLDALVKKGIIENDGQKQVGLLSHCVEQGKPRVEVMACPS